MSVSEPDPLNLVSRSIQDFRILRHVGSGAAGFVYEAERDSRRYALKIYKDWLFESNAESQDARISREAELQTVNHPNVCKVFGFGRGIVNGQERRYLAMEFIEGNPLEALIRHGVFVDWRAFVDVARQLVEAVGALHEVPFVHRDIKPANVMVERTTNRVVLTDFGVVADLEATTLLTEGHEFLGTIAYAAPEWLLRQPEDAARSPSIDVYSMGATFYEMLAGKRLFAHMRNRHQLARAVTETIPSVETPVGYPRRITSLVREMLAKSPDGRPTLSQVRERLSEIAREELEPRLVAKESENTDPYTRFRLLMSKREDVQRSADLERLRKQRWDEFDAIWERLDHAWKPSLKRLAELPGVIDTEARWRGSDDRVQWLNVQELRRSFPDRPWNWGRSFDIVVAAPGVGVQVVYFFHGLEDNRTGITRSVATLRIADGRNSPAGDLLQLETTESWMGSLDHAAQCAVEDTSHAEDLLVQLLNASNFLGSATEFDA